VLEAESRPGGRIRSEPRGDYWLNFGPHLFPAPDTVLGRLVTDVGLQTQPVTGNTLALSYRGTLLASGRTTSYPARLPLPMAGRASLFRCGARIRRGVSKYTELAAQRQGETASDARARLLSFEDDRTFTEYLGPLHPDADAILRAAVRRVSAEPEELAAGAGVCQFATTFSGGGASMHRNLPGGSSVLPDAIVGKLGSSVRLGCEVTSVCEQDGVVEVRWTEQGRPERAACRQVVVATQPAVANKLIAGLSAQVSNALGAMRYGPYVVGSLLTKEQSAMPWDDVYAMVTPGRSFNMFFNSASLLRGSWPRLPGGSLMVYGAADLGRRLLDRPDDEVIAAFLADLGDMFPELPPLVGEMHLQRWPEGIPFSTPGRHRYQHVLEQPIGAVHLAGDYLGARGGMDTAAVSGAEAAQRVIAALH
jgi:protoporphyrinogen/coproporphyrinogen III oxidase